MKIHRIPHVNDNFGDELNGWLFGELRPEVFDERDDGVTFVGIGTILDTALPESELTVVFGTGTGYARPPRIAEAPEFRIYGVRGPLTAAALGLSADKVLTDPAILLATMDQFRVAAESRERTIFVPHWKTPRFGAWQAVCARAGLDYVDPCGDCKSVIRQIASARLVVAESMHAAIIADAFRVPWVPVVLSREVAPFKWADWAASVELDYEPLLLHPSSPLEALRDRLLPYSSFSYIGDLPPVAARAERPFPIAWSREQLVRDQRRASDRVGDRVRWTMSIYGEALLKRAARVSPYLARLLPAPYEQHLERAAGQLASVAQGRSYLSSDAAHTRALERCVAALDRLSEDYRSGALTVPNTRRSGASPGSGAAARPLEGGA